MFLWIWRDFSVRMTGRRIASLQSKDFDGSWSQNRSIIWTLCSRITCFYSSVTAFLWLCFTDLHKYSAIKPVIKMQTEPEKPTIQIKKKKKGASVSNYWKVDEIRLSINRSKCMQWLNKRYEFHSICQRRIFPSKTCTITFQLTRHAACLGLLCALKARISWNWQDKGIGFILYCIILL